MYIRKYGCKRNVCLSKQQDNAILFLAKPALKVLKDYEQQKKEGKDPVFDPAKLGFDNADFWESEYDEALVITDSDSKKEVV